jgi:hypothetical protein
MVGFACAESLHRHIAPDERRIGAAAARRSVTVSAVKEKQRSEDQGWHSSYRPNSRPCLAGCLPPPNLDAALLSPEHQWRRFKAENAAPFAFAWLDTARTNAEYSSALIRISRDYGRRF